MVQILHVYLKRSINLFRTCFQRKKNQKNQSEKN
jgi:hypothetical protein